MSRASSYPFAWIYQKGGSRYYHLVVQFIQYVVRACSSVHIFYNRIMLHRLLRDMVEQVTNFWVSLSSMICPFATFQYWFIGLLTVSMLPIVGAVPSSWSTPTNDAFKRDDGSMNASGTSGTVTTSTTSSTTLPTSSTNPKSDSWSDTHVVLLISREFAYGLIIGKFSCRCCL